MYENFGTAEQLSTLSTPAVVTLYYHVTTWSSCLRGHVQAALLLIWTTLNGASFVLEDAALLWTARSLFAAWAELSVMGGSSSQHVVKCRNQQVYFSLFFSLKPASHVSNKMIKGFTRVSLGSPTGALIVACSAFHGRLNPSQGGAVGQVVFHQVAGHFSLGHGSTTHGKSEGLGPIGISGSARCQASCSWAIRWAISVVGWETFRPGSPQPKPQIHGILNSSTTIHALQVQSAYSFPSVFHQFRWFTWVVHPKKKNVQKPSETIRKPRFWCVRTRISPGARECVLSLCAVAGLAPLNTFLLRMGSE